MWIMCQHMSNQCNFFDPTGIASLVTQHEHAQGGEEINWSMDARAGVLKTVRTR